MPRSSPLEAVNADLGARLVDFGGWSMPVQYSSVLDEHAAVRSGVGVFDVSHLGRAAVRGPGAVDTLRQVFCNDVAALDDGRTQYTMALNQRGGVIDDLMVWRWPDTIWIMPNGANHDRVMGLVRDTGAGTVTVDDLRETTASIAVQGPAAPDLLADLCGVTVRRGRLAEVDWSGVPLAIGGTGYTGERGGEVVGSAEAVAALFRRLVDDGAVPCGLGARDTLRLEAGLPLWGQDLTEDTTPLEAGLDFAVAWDHDFIGRQALASQRDAVPRRLVGFATQDRRIPRPGNALRAGSSNGFVTSGNFSPALGVGIGMGYVDAPAEGDLEVHIRDVWYPVRRVTPPFHT